MYILLSVNKGNIWFSHTLSPLACAQRYIKARQRLWVAFPLFSPHKAGAFKLLRSALLGGSEQLRLFGFTSALFDHFSLCLWMWKRNYMSGPSGESDGASHHFPIMWSCTFSFLLNYDNNTVPVQTSSALMRTAETNKDDRHHLHSSDDTNISWESGIVWIRRNLRWQLQPLLHIDGSAFCELFHHKHNNKFWSFFCISIMDNSVLPHSDHSESNKTCLDGSTVNWCYWNTS